MGTALISMGLKGKRIAIISENRYEWGQSYLAICCGTGIVVPIDKALPEGEIENLIKRSKVEAIFFSEKYEKILTKIKEEGNSDLKVLISMEDETKDGIYSQKDLLKQGKKLIEDAGDRRFIDATIDNESMGIMLFTSGTTDISKAVALSHKNICSNLMDIASVIEVTEKDTMLSLLPLHHTFESTVGFLYPLYKGACVAFCDGIRHFAENINEYKVTVIVSVPLLFENMYKKMMKAVEKQGKLKTVQTGIKISNFLRKFGIDIRKKLFKEIHDSLGGEARLFVSGAAGLDPNVEKGFNDLGFKTVQGYGLTETSPVLAAGNDKYTRIGSVGKAFPSVEVKIENKDEQGIGEIVVKGPNVMLEYYDNEEATKNSLIDGWFYTGDLGYIDKDGYIYITGRKKDVIVLKNGKNVFPEELESLVNRVTGVRESLVYGIKDKDDDTRVCVKIVYDEEAVKEEYNLEKEEDIFDLMKNKIKEINKTMPTYKYIKDVTITKEELIKTTTAKVKRHEELAKINR